MPKPVRILFFACRKLDTAAAAQLILAQNKQQDLVEFNVFRSSVYARQALKYPRTWIGRVVDDMARRHDRLGRYFSRRISARCDRKAFNFTEKLFQQGSWVPQVKAILDEYDNYLVSRSSNAADFRCIATIVITDVAISDGYFSFTNGPVGLISTANWKYYFKPASALDYVLASTQRLALRMVFNSRIGSHFETKGCVWDYCQYQPDARISIFNGYICSDCSRKLKESGLTDEQIEKLQLLTANEWLGTKDDQYSISGILSKNYGYDLSRSTGPSGGLFPVLLDGLWQEIVGILRTSFRWSIVIVLILLITTRFPWVIGLYRSVRAALA